MSSLSDQSAFVHVADAYRWVAAATCTLDDLQRRGFTPKQLAEVRHLVPNSNVAFEASALVYSRALIEFYRPRMPRDLQTDIKAEDFGLAFTNDPDVDYLVDVVKPSIDKHLSHLTEFRDDTHPDRTTKDRLDWTNEIPSITDALVRILAKASRQQIPHRSKFVVLLDAVEKRRKNRSFRWPDELDPDMLNPKRATR